MGLKEEEAATAAAEEEIVLVAISKHPSSYSALKWSLSNKIVKTNVSLKLLHILCSNPTSGIPPFFSFSFLLLLYTNVSEI